MMVTRNILDVDKYPSKLFRKSRSYEEDIKSFSEAGPVIHYYHVTEKKHRDLLILSGIIISGIILDLRNRK